MTDILIYGDIDDGAYELLSWGKKVKDSLNAKLAAVVLGKGAKGKPPITLPMGPIRFIGMRIQHSMILMPMFMPMPCSRLSMRIIMTLLSLARPAAVRNWRED